MESVISVIHIIIAVFLVFLVLIQDSKGGGLGIMSGNSSSILGSTGADSLVVKMTRWTALVFATTCVALTIWNAKGNKSVLDSAPLVATPPAATQEAAPALETESAAPTESSENSGN